MATTTTQKAVLATVATAATVAAAAIALKRMRRARQLGTLPITSSDVSFAQTTTTTHSQSGNTLAWTKHSLVINGVPVVVLAAEFHPWRVPDRARWEAVLRLYKSIGLNAIRIYFHWGFHSPQEGVYHWDGNRDMDYLLTLCEELGLFVIAAPGPYICSETQAGGLPTWLVAKKDVRIRHSSADYSKLYDVQYNLHCREWFQAILPIIAAHQITQKSNGSVILLQIENESFENFMGIPLGSADDMRFLAKIARDCGIDVPLFHNDGFESGSWIARDEKYKDCGKSTFGLDLYSYDKYVVFAPTSNPTNLTGNADSNTDHSKWTEWEPKTVETAMDGMEKKVRGFGGCAATGPCSLLNFKAFYGEDYTRLMYDSSFAQGVTMINYYMGYGGTNWGTLGDPDVYTSYDYSACIREFMHLSGRGQTIRVKPSKILTTQRVSVGDKVAELAFMRNFSRDKKREYVVGLGVLEYKRSFIALGAYTSDTSGVHLLFSTAPVHVRTHVLVMGGEMAFQGEVWVTRGRGDLGASVKVIKEANASVVSFKGVYGWCAIATPAARENADHVPSELLVLALPEDELYKLAPVFEESYWTEANRAGDIIKACGNDPVSVTWGAYGVQHEVKRGVFEIEWQEGEDRVFALFAAGLGPHTHFGFEPFTIEVDAGNGHPLAGFPGLFVKRRQVPGIPLSALQTHSMGQFQPWSARTVDFDSYPWTPLTMSIKDSSVPVLDTIDLGYTAGHVVYKITIPLVLSLDTRNRTIIYLNKEHVIGGHTTYALQLQRYIIPRKKLNQSGVNTLYIMVESWGLNRQAFGWNDVRNARGIRHLKIESEPVGGSYAAFLFHRRVKFELEVAGVDWGGVAATGAHGGVAVLTLGAEKQPRWFQGSLRLSVPHGVRIPLRLHVSGPATAHVWIHGVYWQSIMEMEIVSKGFELSFKVLVYDGRRLESGDVADWVGLQVKGWEMESGAGQQSGAPGKGTLFATTREG
ncbi:hypothetical protein BCR33DRAFT_711885 [Rhizoclosmatium globosum]|uniref:Glycoside hydrolase 35 catalytic domain-containing protein n=1 Tax=Rhizoclosmatium globosum TaxID=329046 RepID=A0A1Y2D019_9FUNG|nr:hypothetical protein BCR33DRAFT_711885 [Rhizoclosmatium globosum]|eukprot:ORY52621.1 hypothetical protein BCR33DRAFT_711885 [Rhizoclosmatium globosum]